MKKINSLFLALCVVATTLPPAALSQVVARPVAGAALNAGAAAASVTGVSAVPALSPLTTLAPAAALNAAPLAASVAPFAAAPSALSAAALPAAAPAAAPALSAAAPAASLPADAEAVSSHQQIRTPGAAATGVAAEAAAYAGETEAAPSAVQAAAPVARKGLVGRLADVVLGRASASSLFDASSAGKAAPVYGRMGLREHKPVLLPNGTRPDEQPTIPSPDREPTVKTEAYALPGARDVGGIFESSRKVLNVDPTNVDAVVAAVKAMVDADPTRYGVNSSELRLIGARRFEGRGDQADSIFVHFRQIKDNLLVNGSNMSFTIKVINGKATVVAQTGQVYPQLEVDTQGAMTEDQIMGKIAERTGMPVSDVAGAFQFFEEKIIYSRGQWRHVKLYVADGLPFMVAVDLSNGLVFAWDNRSGLETARKDKDGGAKVAGSIAGNTVDHGPQIPGAQLKEIPLSFLNLTIGGKTYTTDKDGKFSAPGLEVSPEGLTLTATLAGPFVTIEDTSGKTLRINVTIKPGDGAVQAVFAKDATLNDENAVAQVSAFHKVNLAYNFLRERKLTTERMDKSPIVVRTNVDDECNAYYTPGSPSLNFFRSSANCVNSAYDTVADHEYGHYWDDMTGGIMNGGLSEGWGDTVSMYLLNNPVIGEHFLKQARGGVDYIRHGENTYQYNEYDEVHDQGQAWGGFTWKLRKALMKELGDAEGAAIAEALVLPTMFAKAATIPDAMAQVLVNAMKKDGTIQFEKIIRDTAQIHGITLPSNPGKGLVAGLVERFTAPLRKVGVVGAAIDGVSAAGAAPAAGGAQELAADAGQASPTVRATLKFTAGALLRRRVANEIRRYMDETGLKYTLNEYKSWTSSDFLLVIEGPQDKVQEHSGNIQRWLQSLERGN